MKRLFLGSVALVALSLGTSAGFAADKRVPAYTPPPPPAPVYTWSGCYVGASAGTNSGRTDGFSTDVGSQALSPTGSVTNFVGVPVTGSFNLSGFIGGFQGGCNWQWGAWVFGVEGDGSATNKSGQSFPTTANVNPFGATNPAGVLELQERWLVTARGRLGWTIWDRTMVYVTGGGAWAKIDATQWVTTSPQFSSTIQSDTRGGWTAGAGAEYAVGYGWSVKGEYLYVDFGDYTTFTPCNQCSVGGNATNLKVGKLQDHIWRAGMNYKFW
jgi:outer membrane immunogenic protein